RVEPTPRARPSGARGSAAAAARGRRCAGDRGVRAPRRRFVEGFEEAPVTPGARESDLGRTGLIAVAGLLIMWEALGRLDVSMFSFFVIVVNTLTGVRSTDPSLVEMARSFGAGEFALFGRVYLPSALPAVMLGLRLGVVQAVKGMVVGEMLISLVGLGERLI